MVLIKCDDIYFKNKRKLVFPFQRFVFRFVFLFEEEEEGEEDYNSHVCSVSESSAAE